MLQDGHLERAVGVYDGRDARREVRRVGLVLALHAASAEITRLHDGVGLIAVGDHERVAHRAHRVIDDEARVFQKRGIVGLGADAVGFDGEDAVAAVDRATHDEVVHRILAHHDASARVGVVLQQFDEILHRRSLSLGALSDAAAARTLFALALSHVDGFSHPAQ